MNPHPGIIAQELCAYCGSLLPLNLSGVEAWRIGNRFVCNEFCADGIPIEMAAGASNRRSREPAHDVAGPRSPAGVPRSKIKRIVGSVR
jgi:hypothetical protein